jgi:peptidoglycan hydrolase CwlO-like protein
LRCIKAEALHDNCEECTVGLHSLTQSKSEAQKKLKVKTEIIGKLQHEVESKDKRIAELEDLKAKAESKVKLLTDRVRLVVDLLGTSAANNTLDKEIIALDD